MRTSIALAVSLALLGAYCGYRIASLEERVGGLAKRLGPQPAAAKAEAAGAPPAAGYEQRIAALETEVRSLRADLHSLEEATGERPLEADLAQPNSPQQILAIVAREQNRIRDRQLEFHRARWGEWREAALANFAKGQQLGEAQTEDLRRLLTKETDKMVDILRGPGALENPAQTAVDWAAALDDTDAIALRILDPGQRLAWKQGRALERAIFWPWLPKAEQN